MRRFEEFRYAFYDYLRATFPPGCRLPDFWECLRVLRTVSKVEPTEIST